MGVCLFPYYYQGELSILFLICICPYKPTDMSALPALKSTEYKSQGEEEEGEKVTNMAALFLTEVSLNSTGFAWKLDKWGLEINTRFNLKLCPVKLHTSYTCASFLDVEAAGQSRGWPAGAASSASGQFPHSLYVV